MLSDEVRAEVRARQQFTNTWFNTAKGLWDQLIPDLNPRRILEIGSYEGASASYLIEELAGESDLELHCIDTWEGGVEHGRVDMSSVEQRFRQNMALACAAAEGRVNLVVHKGPSHLQLAKLIAEGREGSFDFIYVDGSHQAPDVLCDAVLAFKLLRVGGLIAFDDYLWTGEPPVDLINCPKMAIDAFLNINIRKVAIVPAPLIQIYLRKLSD